jgi:hypothetical protein
VANFGRGGANAEKAVQENRPAGNFDRIEYFKVEEDEEVICRPVHDGDEWYYVKMHQFIPTKAEPKWWKDMNAKAKDGEKKERKWPERMSFVCRRDKAFEYGECYICDHLHERAKGKAKNGRWYPAIRYFVPFLMREVVRGTQEMIDAGEIPATVTVRGKEVSTIDRIIGYRDQMVEINQTDDDGNVTGTTSRPRVVVNNLGHDNFFGPLQGYYEIPDEEEETTVLNRDWRIKRKGEGTDTKYVIKDMKPTPDFDLRDPETREKYDFIDIEKMMTEMASDERYAKFVDHTQDWEPGDDGEEESGKVVAAKKGRTAAPSKAEQTKPAETEPDDEDGDDEETSESLAALKAKMTKSHGRKPATVGAPSDDEGDDED